MGREEKYLKRYIRRSIITIIVAFYTLSLIGQDTIFISTFDEQIVPAFLSGAEGLNGGKDNYNSWAIGVPNGGRGYSDMPGQKGFIGNADPTVDHSGNNSMNYVAGQGLLSESFKEGESSHYNNSSEWFMTPAINCSNYYNISLTFWRWANFEDSYDKAYVEISTDSILWIALPHPLHPQDTLWTEVNYDISSYANRQQKVFIRWRSESDRYIHYSGWNIDDIIITGEYTNTDATSVLNIGSKPEPVSISSIVDTYKERTMAMDFTVTDNASGDNKPTLIKSILIEPGDANTISDWTLVLHSAILETPSNGKSYIGSVNQGNIEFILNTPDTIADGGSKNYELKIYLLQDLSGINDNDILDFTIDHALFKYDGSGSFIHSGIVYSGSISVNIEATKLAITSIPSSVGVINRSLFPMLKVTAQDENGNRDLDFMGTISLKNSGNLAMENASVTAVQGLVAFNRFHFTDLGGPVYLSTINTSIPKLDNDSVIITIVNEIPDTLFETNFDNNSLAGWTTGANGLNGAPDNNNSWQIGEPKGGLGYKDLTPKGFIGNPDPVSDHSVDNTSNIVIGQGLGTSSKFQGVSSHYNLSNEWIQTPVINCTGMVDVELSFWRWANFENGQDKAYVEVSNDGSNWYQLSHPFYPQDVVWTLVTIDISAYANNQPTVYIRWRSESSMVDHYSGWNIDDISVTAVRQTSTIWTGIVSSDWDDPMNWDVQSVPTSSTVITIPGTASVFPEVLHYAECKSVLIETGASLIIQTSASLDIIGDLTLLSTSQIKSAILDLGSLNVYGNTIYSFVNTSIGWNHFSSPVDNVDSKIFGNKVYYYNEPVSSINWNNGWTKTTEIMQAGKGYNTYNGSQITRQISGTLNTGFQEVIITNTDSVEIPEHEGWNLVGNPYASVIDWDAPNGWIKENVENAIYIWDPVQNNYRSYVDGVGTNGGSRYIEPMVAFFVKATKPGQGRIGMDNRVRTVSPSAIKSKSLKGGSVSTEISLAVSNQQYTDEAVIRFKEDASLQYDEDMDAYKMFSTQNGVPQVYTQFCLNQPMAINSLPVIDSSISIPVYIKVNSNSELSLKINLPGELTKNRIIILEDKKKGTFINMIDQQEFIFTANVLDDTNRFVLHIAFPLDVQVSSKNVTCNASNDGMIDLTVNGGIAPYIITWTTNDSAQSLINLAAGDYSVKITDQIGNEFSEIIKILEPERIQITSYVTNPSSPGIADGLIDNVIKGGILPYTYFWSDNSSDEDLTGITAGMYTITVIDNNGCFAIDTIILLDPETGTNLLSENKYIEPVIYSNGSQIFIQSNNEFQDNCIFKVFTIEGKLILSQNIESNYSIINLKNEGVFLVKLTSDGTTYSKKLYLKP
ncbi:MAG: T9SS type A sorting domain-containing protein [Bacteroidales bacterium]|nr:T9SS type A sorting domain-containing protein [Bacteroidales bacterium]